MSLISQPSVSVYVISHNYGRFLEQAVNSVLAQTVKNIEVIIIDDGSTDETPAVLAKYFNDLRVNLILQQNKGLTVTNNIALRSARGRYIMRLDGDDYLHPEAVAQLCSVLDSDPEIGMVFPDYFEVDEAGKILAEIRRHDFKEVTLMDQPAHGACTMIRRTCLEEIGGYDESLNCQDGYDLWIRFIEHFKVKNINAPLFYYRQHENNMTRNEQHLLDTRAKILERHARRRGHHLNVLAMVPIRGKPMDHASQAFSELAGKTLVEWTVSSALSAVRIRDVVVTTPDDDILDLVARRWPKEVVAIRRDPELARTNTFLGDTLRHALKEYEANHDPVDAIMTLAIECPFRRARHLDAAIDVMELFETDATIGIRPETDHFYRHKGDGLIPVQQNIPLRLERENLYREVGRVRLIKRRLLFENDGIPTGRIGHVVIDQPGTLELRSDFDWRIGELIATEKAFAVEGD